MWRLIELFLFSLSLAGVGLLWWFLVYEPLFAVTKTIDAYMVIPFPK